MSSTGGSGRALVVDGDPESAAARSRRLEGTGYHVVVATSGSEAVEVARRERPAVIVVDPVLPDLDPVEVLRRLRRDASTAGITVVMAGDGGAAGDRAVSTGDRFQALLEAAPDAVLIIDGDGLIAMVNQRTERLFGHRREELVGRTVELLVPERYRDRHALLRGGYLREAQLRDEVTGLELDGLRADGTEFPAEVLLSPLGSDTPPLLSASVRDITDRKAAEATHILAFEREREATARLREVDRLRSDFLSTVSHELRTPLTAIRGFAEWLVDEWDTTPDAQRLEIVRRMLRAGGRLDNLIHDLLDFSRLERGRLRVTLAAQPLSPLVRDSVDNVGSALERHHVDVRLDDGLRVLADRPVLVRALENLLSNAAKFSPPGSTVHVVTVAGPDGPVVVVRDEGVGIPETEHDKVFDRFYRVAETATHHPGTGIGLAIVKQFVEAQGGRVTLSSRAGSGAEFTVQLRGAAT